MFVENIFMNLVEKTMIAYVQPTLANYLLAICTFVYGCQKVIINFISSDWEANHVTIGLLEVTNIKDERMVPKLQESY
jgi:hypothetical protein